MRTIIRSLAQLAAIFFLSISANASVIYEFEATVTPVTISPVSDSIWGSFKLTRSTYISEESSFVADELDSSTIGHSNSGTSISLIGVGFFPATTTADNYVVFYTTHGSVYGGETYWWLPENAFTTPGIYYSGDELHHDAVLTVWDTENAVPEPSIIGLLLLAGLGALLSRSAENRVRDAA